MNYNYRWYESTNSFIIDLETISSLGSRRNSRERPTCEDTSTAYVSTVSSEDSVRESTPRFQKALNRALVSILEDIENSILSGNTSVSKKSTMLIKPDISKFPKLQHGYRLLDQTEVVVEGDKICSRLSNRWTSVTSERTIGCLTGKTLMTINNEFPYILGACRKIR